MLKKQLKQFFIIIRPFKYHVEKLISLDNIKQQYSCIVAWYCLLSVLLHILLWIKLDYNDLCTTFTFSLCHQSFHLSGSSFFITFLCPTKLSKVLFQSSTSVHGTLHINTKATHQPLVSKGVVHTPDEEPEWPEVLKPKIQYKVCQEHQCPHHQKLQVQEGAEDKKHTQTHTSHTQQHLVISPWNNQYMTDQDISNWHKIFMGPIRVLGNRFHATVPLTLFYFMSRIPCHVEICSMARIEIQNCTKYVQLAGKRWLCQWH